MLESKWHVFISHIQVLISGKEEPEAEISPAMDAVVRIFKRVNGISDIAADGTNLGSAAPGTCSVRLLVAASQAVNLIGKKGEAIRTIQETSNATVRVLTGSMCFYESSLVPIFYLMCQLGVFAT